MLDERRLSHEANVVISTMAKKILQATRPDALLRQGYEGKHATMYQVLLFLLFYAAIRSEKPSRRHVRTYRLKLRPFHFPDTVEFS